MSDAPPDPPERGERRWIARLRWLVRSFIGAGAVVALAALLLFHPATPLPPEWNPARPLVVAAPVTPVTGWQLRRTAADAVLCRAALTEAAAAEALPDRVDSDACHIRRRVLLTSVGTVRLAPVETRCEVALRLAMWERHGLRPAAQAAFGTGIAAIDHRSSYACRPMRTGAVAPTRMSLHATAEAIDIAGFVLDDGRRVSLLSGWNGAADEAAFLRAARDSACRWFATTLGPDYNTLHADHFHLQSRGWGLCR